MAVRRSPQQNKVAGTKTNGESVHGINTGITLIHPMSNTEGGQRNQQRHIVERVRAFVVNHIFCRIKFIRNDAMVHEAMKMVMDHEQVPQEQRYAFQTVYTSCAFNFALNSKQSACETAGKKCVVDETLPKFKKEGNKLFTIEKLRKLKQAETKRKKEAFFWFFGEFLLEFVCGPRLRGKQKENQLISKAT